MFVKSDAHFAITVRSFATTRIRRLYFIPTIEALHCVRDQTTPTTPYNIIIVLATHSLYTPAQSESGEAGDLQDGESYDWFFGYSRLAVYLNLHLGGARTGRVLVVGCGNSEVSPKMWDDGWK